MPHLKIGCYSEENKAENAVFQVENQILHRRMNSSHRNGSSNEHTLPDDLKDMGELGGNPVGSISTDLGGPEPSENQILGENSHFLTPSGQSVEKDGVRAPQDPKDVSARIWNSWVAACNRVGFKRVATERVVGEMDAKKMNEDLELELRFRSCSLDDSSNSRQVPASEMPALQVDAPGNNASVEVDGVGVVEDKKDAIRFESSSTASSENPALGNALMVEMGTAAGPLCGNLPSQQFANACSDVFPPEVRSLSSNPVIGQDAAATSNGKQAQPNVFSG